MQNRIELLLYNCKSFCNKSRWQVAWSLALDKHKLLRVQSYGKGLGAYGCASLATDILGINGETNVVLVKRNKVVSAWAVEVVMEAIEREVMTVAVNITESWELKKTTSKYMTRKISSTMYEFTWMNRTNWWNILRGIIAAVLYHAFTCAHLQIISELITELCIKNVICYLQTFIDNWQASLWWLNVTVLRIFKGQYEYAPSSTCLQQKQRLSVKFSLSAGGPVALWLDGVLSCPLMTTSLVRTCPRMMRPNRPKPVSWWLRLLIFEKFIFEKLLTRTCLLNLKILNVLLNRSTYSDKVRFRSDANVSSDKQMFDNRC